jgi:hypothetical protein
MNNCSFSSRIQKKAELPSVPFNSIWYQKSLLEKIGRKSEKYPY